MCVNLASFLRASHWHQVFEVTTSLSLPTFVSTLFDLQETNIWIQNLANRSNVNHIPRRHSAEVQQTTSLLTLERHDLQAVLLVKALQAPQAMSSETQHEMEFHLPSPRRRLQGNKACIRSGCCGKRLGVEVPMPMPVGHGGVGGKAVARRFEGLGPGRCCIGQPGWARQRPHGCMGGIMTAIWICFPLTRTSSMWSKLQKVGFANCQWRTWTSKWRIAWWSWNWRRPRPWTRRWNSNYADILRRSWKPS